MSKTTYPVVEGLQRRIERGDVEIRPAQSGEWVLPWKMLDVTVAGDTYSLPVMDEFGDIEAGNPVVLLHLVLAECVAFEEADGFEEWLADVGRDHDARTSQKIYGHMAAVVPGLRAAIGQDVEPVDDFDWQLNAGAAQALRATGGRSQ